MQNNLDRAKQFLPFDALKGFREALKQKEKNVENRKEICDFRIDEINEKLKMLKKGMLVKISYYYNFEYVELVGKIKNVDNIYKKIYLLTSIINFDDIVYIEVL